MKISEKPPLAGQSGISLASPTGRVVRGIEFDSALGVSVSRRCWVVVVDGGRSPTGWLAAWLAAWLPVCLAGRGCVPLAVQWTDAGLLARSHRRALRCQRSHCVRYLVEIYPPQGGLLHRSTSEFISPATYHTTTQYRDGNSTNRRTRKEIRTREKGLGGTGPKFRHCCSLSTLRTSSLRHFPLISTNI